MRLIIAFLLSALATTSGRVIGDIDRVKANSKAGKTLLSKARLLKEDENNYDYSWLPGYTFSFQRCYSWDAFGREERGRKESYVVFRACPQGSCSANCRYGADYIVEMRDYVKAYIEAKQTLEAYNCEQVEANCACNDDQVDDQTCLSNCYAAAGINYCENQGNGNKNGNNNKNNNKNMYEEFDECRQLEMGDNDDGSVYYASMYCADGGKSVNLGIFTDEECTVKDTSNAYKAYYGNNLPYSSKSIVGSGCVSCKNPYYVVYDDDQQNNNNNKNNNNKNGNNNNEVSEMCAELYNQAGKCESNLKIDNPTTSACNYIHNVVPSLSKLFEGTKMAPTSTLTVFFGVMCGVLLGVCYYLFKHQKTTNINLADQGGVLT